MNRKLQWEDPCVTELSRSEMNDIFGGGLIDLIAHYVGAGLTYFYNMGLSEARHYRKRL